MRQEFEYKTERIEAPTSDMLTRKLNKFGIEGWELTSLVPFGVYPVATFLAVFQRNVGFVNIIEDC